MLYKYVLITVINGYLITEQLFCASARFPVISLYSNPRKAAAETIDGIFKLVRSPGIDSKEPIPPAYVAWQAVR
jgi:hypothetical protein